MKCIFRVLGIVAAGLAACLSSAQITLRLTSWEGDIALNIQRDAVKQFEATHPGIQVKLENIDHGLYFQKLLTMFAANVAPDVAMMGFENFQPFAKRGVLMPLDDVIRSTPGFDLSQWYPEIIQVHRYQGKLYVLPRDIAPMGLIYYNKQMFKDAGIPYPDGSWTWDFKERPELKDKDFLWVIHRLSKFGSDGKPTQWGFVSAWPGLLAQSFALPTGGRELDDYANPTKVLYDSPEMIRAYQFAADLMFKNQWVPSNQEITSVLQTNTDHLFSTQKVAMMEGGIWEVPNIRKDLIPEKPGFFDWDLTMFPAYKDGTRMFPSGGSGYSIVSSTKYPKEAWELLKFMTSPDVMQKVAAAGLAQPAIRRLAISEPWVPGPNTPLESQYPHNRIVTDEAVKYVKFAPSSEYYPALQTYINPRVDTIWTGEHTPQEALTQATQDAQQQLDNLRRKENLPEFNWVYGGIAGIVIAVALIFWIYWPERGRKLSNKMKAENRSAYKFLAPWIIGFLVFTLGPMVFSLLMSGTDWDIITAAKWRGLGNFGEALGADPRFFVTLKVTAIYTLFAVPLGIIGSLLLALLLNLKVRGMALFRTMYYIPSLASLVAASLIWRKLFQPNGGLIDDLIYGTDGKGNFLGLAHFLKPLTEHGGQVNWLGSEHTSLASLIIMSLWGIGGGMVILLAGLQGIPDFYYEAAKLDGANAWHRFKAVTLPLLTPALFFVMVTGFIGSFQVFTQSFVMTSGGPGDSTRFFMLYLYDNAFTSLRMGYASSLAWFLFFIILALTGLQLKLSKWVYVEG
ncbi:MAG TPA: extracellular solute-binding protein [Fimbriimonadaceae bacterium]